MKHFPVEVTYSLDVYFKLAFINSYTSHKKAFFFLFYFSSKEKYFLFSKYRVDP